MNQNAESRPEIEIIRGNIVTLDVDCVVNAANAELQHGAGVCGAIFSAAGAKELQAACDRIGGCPTGRAVITEGYRLKAQWVIHAVGPRYGRDPAEAHRLLRSTYDESLKLAASHGVRSIAFPSISTGIYGFPIEEACPIAIQAVLDYRSAFPQRVIFCCFSESDLRQYLNVLERLTKTS